jgi:hypothetical protein
MTISPPPTARPSPASRARLAGIIVTTALAGIGALHAAWGAGSSWPMSNRTDLVDAVVGAPGSHNIDSAACYAVAATLGTAAAMVAGWPKQMDTPRRAAVVAIATALAARGALGLTGHTRLVSPNSTGMRFQRLDRRIYSPLCLTLAGLTAVSLTGNRRCEP